MLHTWYRPTQRLRGNYRQAGHTDEAMLDVETLSTRESAKTGQRGYLLTGNEAYLRPYW